MGTGQEIEKRGDLVISPLGGGCNHTARAVLCCLSVRFVSARDIVTFAVLFVYILSAVSVFPRPVAAYYDFFISIYDKNLK